MSHKVIGNINWVLCKGYPQVSGSDGVDQLTVRYTVSEDGLASLPEYGDLFAGGNPGDADQPLPGASGWLEKYRNMRLQGRNIAPLDSGDVFEVTLTYAFDDDEHPDDDAPVKEEWECDTQDYDVPLAQHPKYLYCWNHKLAAKSGSSIPGWFSTATDDVMSKSDAAVYKWLKSDDKCPEGYAVIAKQTKKAGVESFRRGITTVQWIKRCASKSKLQASAAADYTMQTPKETFHKTGLWLRGGSKIRKNGRFWEMTVSFLNTQDFDVDLYE